jgi:hypothetical protein
MADFWFLVNLTQNILLFNLWCKSKYDLYFYIMTLKKPSFSQTLAILAACFLSTMLCLAHEVSNEESSKIYSHVQVIFIDTLSSSSPSANTQLDSNMYACTLC